MIILYIVALLRICFQIQKDIHSKMPEILQFIRNEDVRTFFENSSLMVVSRAVFLDQLDLVDNAACGWLSLMKGININVFKGFATEGELVDYFLNDAYANNVQVLASMLLSVLVGTAVSLIIFCIVLFYIKYDI